MSMKIVLNKLTSMVLVICMLLSLAAPAVGEEPLTQPVEETVYSEGSTVYADGTVVYADGTIVYADGTTVHTDGTTVDADGTTLYADGTTVYADGKMVYVNGTVAYPDGTVVYPDGTTLNPDGTTVYPDGTTVYPDGTTVYAEDSSDSDPAEESVHLTAPEPIIPDTVIETPENPEEPEELKEPEMTPADPAVPADPGTEVQTETDGDSSGGEEKTAPTIPGKEAENPEEATADATEEATEENAEKTAEGTEDDTAEESPEDAEENPAAPVEELPLRTLTASADQMAFRDQFLNPREPVLWSSSVWNWLYGTAIEPLYTDDRVMVEISGHLPETVTARAMFIEFADPGAARNDERALMLLDVALLDETGAVYVPTEKLHVSVSSASISGAAASGEPFAAYFDDSYDGVGDAGDIKVRLDEYIDGSRLSYVPEQNEALRFWEAGGRLVSSGNGTVEFDENRFPFRFVLSAQQEEREEEQTEQQNVVRDVSLSGTLVASDGYTYEVSVSYPANCGIPVGAQLSVEELIVGTDAYWDYINQSAAELGISPADLSLARAFDISLVDPETGVHYQPTQDVQVSITLISTPVNTEEEIEVLHFDDEAGQVQAMDVALNGEAIEFETGSFSVFVVLQRVIEKNLDAGDGYTYHISVDYDNTSGIPDGVELVADELLEGDAFYDAYVTRAAAELGESVENLSFARAFNISLMDPLTGIYYQPNKNVKVSIQVLNENLSDYESVDVVHFGNDVEVMNASVNGEAVEFVTDGFSVYVITGSNGETITPQCTYTFFIPNQDAGGTYTEYIFTDDQGRVVSSQTIKNGDRLTVPQPPSSETEVFAGWYVGHPDGQGGITFEDSPYDFDHINITEPSVIHLYARYKEYAYVVFHDQYDRDSGTFPIAYSRRVELATDGGEMPARIKISDLSTTYTGSDDTQMAFFGWSETPITNPGAETDDAGRPVSAVDADSDGCITVTGTTHLYPIYKETHWLTYYTAQSGLSAAYVPPAQYFKGDPVDETPLPITSRDGYHFKGWYTGALVTHEGVETVNYGTQITDEEGYLVLSADDGGVYISAGKLYLRANATLFAKWEATYRIVYWKQVTTEKPETAEKHYEYAETATRTANITNWGETIDVADDDKADNKYPGYTFNNSLSVTSAEINNTKDLTVFNLYYDLTEDYSGFEESYKLTFEDSVTGGGIADMPAAIKDLPYKTKLKDYKPDTDPASGRTSDTGKKIYNFSGWYMDQACTIPVDWNVITMPDRDLTIYAGWEPIRFTVDIDPNYGALYTEENETGTGATFFNSSYDAEPIGEYTHVTRNYAESSSGNWYYVNHDRAYGGDRHTYYTQNPGLATEDTGFEYAPGTYTYVGWYEVYLDEDGNEIGEASQPYDFSQHVDHNTKLRLHWKKTGHYYLAYAAGDGTLESGEKELLLPDAYADYATVLLTKSATAPSGWTFVGWKIRGSDSDVIYAPGQNFTLHAGDAKRVSGKDVVYLDAVYVQVGTASIIYDANGGAVAGSDVNFGQVPGSNPDEWIPASGTIDEGRTTATVSGLANNTRFKLSDGRGFTAPDGSGAAFLGWSDKAVCDDSAVFYSKDSTDRYGVDTDEPITLYAVWGVQVNYNLYSTDAEWGAEWDSVYNFDTETNIYSQIVNRGSSVSEPENIPIYNGSDGRLFRYWATKDGDQYTEYDFSQPVTGALDLYAFWSEPMLVKVHAVDASQPDLTETTWETTDVTVGTVSVDLTVASHVTAPDDYAFAFAAVADSPDSVSDSHAVSAVKYDSAKKSICVKYEGDADFTVLERGQELYFVYYQQKTLNIGYKCMESGGALTTVPASGAPSLTSALGEYNMTESITQPLSWVDNSCTHYAFAIGSADAASASALSLVTDLSGTDTDRPALQLRNTWRGFEYSTDGNDWVNCGYNPALYVIYYTQQPTVIMLREQTVGTRSVMETAFTYDLLITETATTITSVQEQRLNSDQWENAGEPTVTTTSGEPVVIVGPGKDGYQPYELKNGEADSVILFYSSTSGESTENISDDTRTVTTTTVITEQTAVITQTANAYFTTAIDGVMQNDEPYSYTCNADGTGGTRNVTFTNTHKSLPVEVHVVLAEQDGTDGIIRRDNLRSTTYSFDLALGTTQKLLDRLPAADVFTGDDNYAFGAILYGAAVSNDGEAVTIDGTDAVSVAYEQSGETHEILLKDAEGNTIGELGSNAIYYLYYPMPRIRYVKANADGSLTNITGSHVNAGNVEESDDITYNHDLLTMNGRPVEQNQSVEVPASGLTISQSGNNFRMPPILDDGLFERYLSYTYLGAGTDEASDMVSISVSDGLNMQLRVQNNVLQYSFDGTEWTDLSLSGIPTIYAIYTERGYDLQISKTVDTGDSGAIPPFTDASFTVTISSMAITKDIYEAEGAEGPTVEAEPSDGDNPGSITLTVEDGTRIRIKKLGHGDYSIVEAGNENYNLTVKTGPILGSAASDANVTDNTTVSITLDTEKRVDLTNSPKPLCKINDNGIDHIFYTLQSAVEYVEENIASYTATIEMLADYLVPAVDVPEIPNGFNITLTTAEEGFQGAGDVAVLTRTPELSNVPMMVNNGTLKLMNVVLEGAEIPARAPVIQSAGDLTIGLGTTIQNAVSSGNGGAVNATAGNIAISGKITGNTAAAGGAIYHSGNGTITITGTGALQNNTASSGNGGAISLASGTISLSGTSVMSGNIAESGYGGAIWAGNAVIEVGQNSSITNNKAKSGGAIYADTATVSISETEGVTPPGITSNTATDGNGGAIHVGTGSVTVSGGRLSNNKAAAGLGGAIHTENASVTVSNTAEVKSNTATKGGAVYSASGTVTVSGAALESNTASVDGGAIYAGSGKVTVSGGSLSKNKAETGSGGALYSQTGNLELSGGVLGQNTSKENGGAVYAGFGSVTVSGEETELTQNSAAEGRGGAIYAGYGAVSITASPLTKNSAGSDGGAIYAGHGAVNLTDAVLGGSDNGNTAGKNGGAVYAGSGNVTVAGGSMSENSAADGNGGALYAGSGAITLSNTTLTGNKANAGTGGAVYLDSGSATLTTVTATDNRAVNGAAVFTKTGRTTFNDGSYTGNIATTGGAVGAGSKEARLYFNGNVQVKDNKLGNAEDAPKSNVYLDQDDDAVINIDTLGSNASIGIYVADNVENTRGVPGARFAVYTSNGNVNKITNDRYSSLTVQSDTAAKKLFWGNSIKVTVRALTSFKSGFPPMKTDKDNYTTNAYYPEFNDAAISELAAELFKKYGTTFNPKLSNTAVYAGAYLDDATEFGEYLTKLAWDNELGWVVTRRDGTTKALQKAATDFHRIYIYYAEPAYISIENNTDMTLNISEMKVHDTSVINSSTEAGYGMVFAKNGAIRSALLPITAADLTLTEGQSVSLLIPGGQNMTYTLDGKFVTTTGGGVRLRRGAESALIDETVDVATDGTFAQLTGNTLNTAGTYNIIFGNDKIICKVVDAGGTEHPYSKISLAIADIIATAGANPPYTLETDKTATIEMVTDYLLTASDDVNIPQGYDITLTTAAKDGATYCYNGTGDRATISRDSQNTNSMIEAWNALASNKVVTTLRLENLIIDGKSVRGSSDGGAVATQYTNVYIDNVDFKNVYASNGGALLVMFNFNRNTTKEAKATLAGTILEVKNSDFTGCTSTTTVTSNRLGGGAIVTNAETMTLEFCDFSSCTAVDQAGAVFHRVDGNYNSWTNVTGCTFTNCSANAAGGLELDSKTINVTGCRFEHCVAKERNGGGFNVYALNAATPTADCWVTVSGCTFNDCQLTTTNTSNGNGGGFRCNAVYTKVENSTFTNNLALYGGGFCISNGNAKKGEVYGCTFERNTANLGGGIFGKPLEMIIGDYTGTDGEGVEQTRHTEIKNCTSNNDGGGIYHDKNADNTSLTITNATISGNQTKNDGKNGGGVFTNCRAVTISGAAITDNACTKQGGGVYAYSYTSLTITDSDISRNIASSDGGGVWFDADNDTNRAKQVLTIKGSTIDGNSSNGSGGGIFTKAKTVTVGASETRTDNGKPIPSSISDNTAKTNGGGIYQSRNADGSKLEISNASVNGNMANNTNTGTDQGGGGIYAGVRTLTITESEVSNNTAKSHGGGVLFEINNDSARADMTLTVEGCTLDTNTSGGNGGGIYTRAKTVEIKAYTEGEGENSVTNPTTISNCTATASGGGIYHSRDAAGSQLTIRDAVIRGCISNDTNTAWDHGGGGVFAYVRSVTVTGSEISSNSAKGKGGGISMGLSNSDYMLTIENSQVTENSSANQGGGIATRSQLTLRNGTEISGNRLSTNTVSDCAGVYLINERTLFVGPEDAAENFTDTIYVRDNVTANGATSDLRLWDNGSENNSSSAYVYCNLDGEIYVVNANKVGTWFGSSEYANPDGFSDTEPVFKADASTLHGIIDRSEESGKKIIWAGPPIAKITDGQGNLLYRKSSGNYPAIFDRLGTGDNNYSSVAAFNMLCTESPELYTETGVLYTGTEYCIKMLDSFETSAYMNVMDVGGRTVTFTTAGKKDTDYPYVGSGTRATVTRGSGVAGGQTTLVANGNLNLKNIVLDGGAESGITPGGGTRCMYINNSSCTVTLGENALLQNGHLDGSHDGGGVYINSGELKLEGGVIRNCTARNGGGVYENGGKLTLSGGSNIYQCTATGNGGGVCQNNGEFAMSGGTVSNSRATQGGGVYVVNNKILNMSGGSITNNTAGSAGGGIAVGGNGARLNFSQKVNISGNRCDTSKAANKICNIELNQDSNKVINTKYGGLAAGSYIGVYVPDGDTLFNRHGDEKKPFGTFADGDKIGTFYSFVNDRNGLKGGIIENPEKNTIYWIQIFSLQVSKTVLSSSSSPAETSEQFKFTVTLRGKATATGQKNAWEIDSWEEGADYGEMWFTSNGTDKTTATFSLEDGQSVTGMNLSKGLDYEVIENLTTEQEKKYSVLPATVYSSKIGENSDRTDVDPYASVVEVTNILPICKITDHDGNLLYRKYTYSTGPESKTFYVPAVYTELTGDFVPTGTDASTLALPYGAFTALEKETFYQNSGTTRYNVENGVHVEMLVPDYTLNVPVQLPSSVKGPVTLTTASENAVQFPFRKQDSGITSTITRGFNGPSMFTVGGNLVLTNIVLDGAKGEYIAEQDGGIINVGDGGTLTIREMATLQNSRSSEKGAAVYVASGGHAAMSGGKVRNNESDEAGAGIYLDYETEDRYATLMLSGSPDFGGKGVSPGGEINPKVGNFKGAEESLVAKTNGGKLYTRARQDIYIAGFDNGLVTSLVVHGELTAEDGSIWIWAEHQEHYETLKQFAVLNTPTPGNLKAFRNAQPDDETKNTTGDYLYGVLGENGHINWSGITGSRRVVLRKVVEKENAFESLEGAVFEVHRNSETGQIVIVDGQPLSGLNSGPSGVFWIGELPYGKYFIKEISPGVKWFVLTVDKDGVGYLSKVGEEKNYSNKIYKEKE